VVELIAAGHTVEVAAAGDVYVCPAVASRRSIRARQLLVVVVAVLDDFGPHVTVR
jgi:hypothetical protein